MAVENLSFEEALTKLEQIVQELERGNLALDRALEAFEEGVRLVRFCQAKLSLAEGKISLFLQKENGGVYQEELKEEELFGN